ncbi:MAG TPA: heme ABC exporter ATP-binding protein CcmA [Gemmataceae bacterium]|nr:heme ABC exporter ATP-binding protein CcmA [Gemmataceae bacterium]
MNEELSPAGQPCYALEARNLSVVRGNRVVFQGVNLTLASGEIVALIGCNGAGKTTLLQCLAGALRPAGGEVLWQGKKYRKCPAARRLVGFVGHESSLYLALTAWENLLFAARMWGIDAPEKRAEDLLTMVGLEDHAAQTTSLLSRGMRQRLAIARAVIHDPAMVLLDEPFTSLDVDGRKWLTAFLCDLRKRNRALILATHESVYGSGFVDRLVSLRADGLREIQPSPGPEARDEGRGARDEDKEPTRRFLSPLAPRP